MRYNNRPKTAPDGKSFQSTLECDRYQELLLLEKAGKIQNLQTQVPFRLDVGGVHVCKYYADFVYDEAGRQVVEDTKGNTVTTVYTMKKRLMKGVHGIDIKETRRGQVSRLR